MSASVWCQKVDGDLTSELHENMHDAIESLGVTLDSHEKRGHTIVESRLNNEPYVIFSIKDADGNQGNTYWIED